MNKNIKQIAAVTMSCSIIAGTFSGCDIFAKSYTMEEIFNEVSSYDSYSSDMSVSFNNGTDEAAFSLKDSVNKTDISIESVSLKGIADEETIGFSISDPLIYRDGKMYINVGNFVDLMNSSNFEELAGCTFDQIVDESELDYDFKSIGWVEMPFTEINPTLLDRSRNIQSAVIDDICTSLKNSKVGFDRLEKNKYEIRAEDKDSVVEIMEIIRNAISNNKESFVSLYKESYKSVDFNSLEDEYSNLLTDMILKFCDQTGISYTDDDKATFQSQIARTISFEDVESAIESSMDDSADNLDELIEKFDELIDVVKDSEDADVNMVYSIYLTGPKDKHEIQQTLNMDFSENTGDDESEHITFSLSSTTMQATNLSIDIPDSVKGIDDIGAEMLVSAIPEEKKEQLKEITLSDLLNNSGVNVLY